MLWYFQIVLYAIGFFISFIALSNVEWARIVRTSRRESLWIVYIVISIVIGFLLGFMMITIGNVFLKM